MKPIVENQPHSKYNPVMEGKISRRHFNRWIVTRIAGAAALGSGITAIDACGDHESKTNPQMQTPAFTPTIEPTLHVEKQPQPEIDAIMRAADVRFAWESASGFTIKSGHGGLFQDGNGEISIKSIGHVLNFSGMELYGASRLTVQIPGVSAALVFSPELSGWQTNGLSDVDTIYSYTLGDGDVLAQAKNQIKSGALTPLVQKPFSELFVADVLATPGGLGITTMSVQRYDRSLNQIVCSPVSGELCEGFSGQPAVLIDNMGKVTDKSFGFVAAGDFPDITQKCTRATYYLRPND